MGIPFGWKAQETRESIWIGDSALKGVTATAREAWERDGDASHLRPFATDGNPQIITFRNLNGDEKRLVTTLMFQSEDGWFSRACYLCFRIGVDFQEMPVEFETPTGQKVKRIVRDHGIQMQAIPFVDSLDDEMVAFYGARIFNATFASEAEKKASSPPSTPTPSASGTDAPSPAAAGAAQNV